ncbi:MAG: hypothetical protein JXR05_11325 [Flavobacteriaceae bacterium]
MRNFTYLLLFMMLYSCSSVKRSENNLYKGNYDEAIRLSIKKIQKSRNKKSSKEHIQLLQQAFKKAVSDDIARIELLEKEGNPEKTKEIFNGYTFLEYRQKLIRPLLPLENATFEIVNYTDAILKAKDNYTRHLFLKGSDYLTNGNTIIDARKAHNEFSKLRKLQPTYRNIDSLLSEAHFKGTDFVYVTIQNNTEQVIPKRLEEAMLDFDTYRLDDFWTEYHGVAEEGIDYNYGVVLDLREILVSPERISEKEFVRKKEISDGWEYKLDANGNVEKDSLGNDIKLDVFKEIRAKVLVSSQSKSALVGGNVVYRDLKQNRNISQFPITSEFIFEHVFARYKGDKKALTKNDKRLVRRDILEFPSNEDMIFDTNEDLKNKFSRILRKRSFR